MIGKTISHYKILEKLGEGGMGVVYKAEDTKLDRHVALKFLPSHLSDSEEEKQRFIHEAKAASALNHPNIMTIHEIDEVEGETFIAMEVVEGETLKDKLEKGPLKTKELLNIAIAVSDGLNAAHEQDIVHRDIKSENIMISKTGPVKIMDFGLAKRKGRGKITKTGSTLGTLSYMSPEQAEGLEVDRRSDLFSFGVVMYEMATGQLPFKGEHDAAVLYAIVNEAPLPVSTLNPNIPKKLEEFIHKALEKEVEDRYQHADDLLADLRRLKKEIETKRTAITKAHIPISKEPGKKPIWQWPWVAAFVLIVAIGVGIFLRYVVTGEREHILKRKMLAVLPFENLGSQEDDYFADGITDAITARLVGIHGLGVIARTSSVQYKGSDKSAQTIGKELGVDYILEGTIQRERPMDPTSRVRVIPQLVSVSDETHLWAGTYDEDMTEVFGVQSEIAERVARALDITLLDPERRSLEAKPTDNLEAYEFYLRGNDYYNRKYIEKDTRIAKQMYEKAVELDPSFAVAWAALSKAQVWLSWQYRYKDEIPKAKASADRALQLDPDLPEARMALGYYYYYSSREYDKALEQFAIVQRQQPSNAEVIAAIGWIRRRQGKWEDAVAHVKEALELNPRVHGWTYSLGRTYLHMRQYQEAEYYLDRAIALLPSASRSYFTKADVYIVGFGDLERAREAIEEGIGNVGLQDFTSYRRRIEILSRNYEKALEIAESDTALLNRYYNLGRTYSLLGQDGKSKTYLDSARVQYEELVQEEPDNPFYHTRLGNIYAGLDLKDKAIQEGKKAVELLPLKKDALAGPRFISSLAFTYLLVGEYDLAIDQLELLFSIPSGVSAWTLKLHPFFDPLRDHPRFQKLVAEG